jgi:hypothetical protein
VLLYLFCDQDGTTTLAYSTDVTGRNLPRKVPRTKWAFVSATSDREISEGEEVIRHLRRRGFYIFER